MTLIPFKQKPADKTAQILQGALSEFLEYGYVGTSMDRLAQAAGVSKQTLYSHFGDKEGLFRALIEQVACHKFQLVWAKPLKGEPERVLRELAYRITEEVKDPEYLAFVHLVITESKNYPDLGQLFITNVAKPAIVTLTKYLEESEDLSLKDCEATARIFVSTLIHQIVTQEMLLGKEIIPISEKRIIDSLIDLIMGSCSGGSQTS